MRVIVTHGGRERDDGVDVLSLDLADETRDVARYVFGEGGDGAVAYRCVGAEECWETISYSPPRNCEVEGDMSY